MRDSEVIELTMSEAASSIRVGEISAVSYAELLLDRCDALAHLGAFIAIDRRKVLAEARAADAELKSGHVRGPLHGVPIAVKDNIDVAGMPATAGTPGLRHNVPTADAAVVARLRRAGAIVLGKANMHELAAGITTDNPAYGTARNPYDEERVPGGSSGGTAVAVSARLVAAGLGTDTGASNRLPASYCGVVGFRPSAGRWPEAGLIPNSTTRDTAGPMARSVEDCAVIDAVVTGNGDLPQIEMSTLRIGVPKGHFWNELDPAVAALGQEWLRALGEVGVTFVEADIPEVAELTARAGMPIGIFEHEEALTAYLQAASSSLSFADILENVASPDVAHFLREMRGKISAEDYASAMNDYRPKLQQAYSRFFSTHAVDAVAFPTCPILPPRISDCRTTPDDTRAASIMIQAIRNTDPGSIAGIPGISIPGGQTPEGLPVGLELDGPAGSDRRLLALAMSIAPVLPSTFPPITRDRFHAAPIEEVGPQDPGQAK